jgi:dihydroneopterin triphosphate diphosphatase
VKKIRKALVVITWRSGPSASEKKVLMLKVTPDRGSFWQPVTGGIDEGESFVEGALREAEEETGLSFDRTPQYLGLEFSYTSRHGAAAREKCYLLPILGGTAPPAVTLDPKEHVEFCWVSPAEALALAKFSGNQKAISRATQELPPLLLTSTGSFYQEGEEITHERTALLLHRSLEKRGENFVVKMGSEEIDVVVETFPRFVTSYDSASGEITLKQGEREKLEPESLRVESDHRFVCETAEGMEAVFLSPAYYEITKSVRQESNEFFLHFLGRDYRLAVPT